MHFSKSILRIAYTESKTTQGHANTYQFQQLIISFKRVHNIDILIGHYDHLYYHTCMVCTSNQ
jgi:hypothetical protein